MSALRMLAAAVLIACLAPAFAQDASQPIERQMTPEEFKAAGLDKLTPDELAHLNAWLGRTISTESEKAAALAADKVKQEGRGFFTFGSEEPISGRMTGHFKGFARGRRYTLDNGQVWEQIDDTELPGVTLEDPEVNIKPSVIGNAWYLKVGKYNTRAQVRRVK
ncbi:MAG: hypothetical protein ACTHKZ_11485 [Lysobacteraceae bacterium]